MSLTALEISYNQLTHLPNSIGNLTLLAKLYVGYNQLTHLPSSVGNLTMLKYLTIGHNPITSTDEGKDEVNRRFGRDGLKIS